MIYIYTQDFPNRRASCVHVTGLCEAFSRLEETDLFVLNINGYPLNYIKSFGIQELSLKHKFNILRSEDLIITRSIKYAILYSLLGRDTILDIHADASEWRPLHRAIIRFLSPLLVKRLKVSVITKSLQNSIFLLFERYKVKVIPDASVDFLQKSCLSINKVEQFLEDFEQSVIGYCGSFNPGKGVSLVLDLAEKMPLYPFIVVGGDESDLIDVRKILIDRGINNVFLSGYVPNSHVQNYLNFMDICLLPNRREVFVNGRKTDIGSHTSPLKLFEYFSMGKAVIASDIEVLKEVLDDKRNCLLVDPEDIKLWVHAIESLANNEQLAETLRCAARKDFETKYSWTVRANNLKVLNAG